jgi:APA family basic amino acid/polyamine antiporter
VARKLPALQKVLDAPALFSVVYGEVASSIYFALGIIAFYALGLTPLVLLVVGVLFFVVALSYAEGTATVRETGGAATFARKAFNDLVGFGTGWVLFLDYLIVIALSALFLPHYLGVALGIDWLNENPGDVIVGAAVIVLVAAVRLVRRPALYRIGLVVAVLDVITQALVLGLGFSLVFSYDALTRDLSFGAHPSWHDVAFALPLAMLAYTGLETVANLAEEARRPGRDLPRSLFAGIGTVVTITVAIAVVALAAFPAPAGGETELGTKWLRSPIMGVVSRIGSHLPGVLADVLRVYVGVTGALILLAAVTTSFSGFGRLAYSLGEHGMLPRAFGRLNRRTVVSPWSLVSVTSISIVILVATSFAHDDVAFLASLFSFGVLLAFTVAQLAVIRLRFLVPEQRRPFRVPGAIRGVPVLSAVGALATFALWLDAMATHAAARYAGPAWLAAGLVMYVLIRRGRGEGLTERVLSPDEQELPQAPFTSILVPMKLGLIGEEMIATAVKLAQEQSSTVEALHVIRVPLDKPLDAELPDEDERAAASLSEAALLGHEHGVRVVVNTVRARSIGDAIVREAELRGVDLIVLGSAPRWRRQSRFFSPTVEYVLKKAPCEVLIVAFPQGVLEQEAALG